MANILLLEPDDTSRRALQGILARGSHRSACVSTAQEAWDFIRRSLRVDLVVVELELKGDGGIAFIEQLKGDRLLQQLPVVIYTGRSDREVVKRGLELHVQNFLIKPYHDEAVFAELAKVTAAPWRDRQFEAGEALCQAAGITTDRLRQLRENLRKAVELAREPLAKVASIRAPRQAAEILQGLLDQAGAAGAHGVTVALQALAETARTENWTEFTRHLETLELAGRMIQEHLNPATAPEEFPTEEEQHKEREARDRATWFGAAAEQRCPVTNWPQIQRELEALPGFPVIDSAAAAFQMSANGHPSSLSPLMDLVDKDPGLAAHLLVVINKDRDSTDMNWDPIEDPRLAIGMLGELRLAAQAKGLVTTAERLMTVPSGFNWRQFWMFQIGTGRLARYACGALELPDLAAPAYTAGLLHDLGKLLLLHLHPFGLQAAIEHARRYHLPLAEAEKFFIGCTTQEMAVHFAEKQGLPRRYANVLRGINAPQDAREDRDLVAVVSLARNLCRHNHLGSSGDQSLREEVPLEKTAEWGVLSESVFPSFNLRKFERQVHAACLELKLELHGRLANYTAA